IAAATSGPMRRVSKSISHHADAHAPLAPRPAVALLVRGKPNAAARRPMLASPGEKKASSCERSRSLRRVSSSGTNSTSTAPAFALSPKYALLRTSEIFRPFVQLLKEKGPPETVGPFFQDAEYACAGRTMSSTENNDHHRRIGWLKRRRSLRGPS